MELYQCKLMVLHAAYLIDAGLDFKSEVSMAKHFVANALRRIIDRAIQVHGALGYSTDTPLAKMATQARWARFADGADEVHQMRIAQRTIEAYKDAAPPRPPPATCRSSPEAGTFFDLLTRWSTVEERPRFRPGRPRPEFRSRWRCRRARR